MKNMTRCVPHQAIARMILFSILLLITYLATTLQAKPILQDPCFVVTEEKSCCVLNGVDFEAELNCGTWPTWKCDYFIFLDEVDYLEIERVSGNNGHTAASFVTVPKGAYCEFEILNFNGPTGGCGNALVQCVYMSEPVRSYCETKELGGTVVACFGS